MSEAVGKKVPIIYTSKSVAKHPVRGMATKEYYGYRRRGDQFDVYESDARVRPDLYRLRDVPQPTVPTRPSHRGRPQEKANVLGASAVAEAVQAPPAPPAALDTEPNEPDPYELPPPLEMEPRPDVVLVSDIDLPLSGFVWKGKVNKNHLKILADNDITMLGDLIPLTEDNVLSIKGIGAGVTRALFAMLKEHRM